MATANLAGAIDVKRLGVPDVATHDVSNPEADELAFDIDLSHNGAGRRQTAPSGVIQQRGRSCPERLIRCASPALLLPRASQALSQPPERGKSFIVQPPPAPIRFVSMNVLVRDIPDDVDAALQRRAERRGQSLQQYLADELRHLAEQPSARCATRARS